MKIYAFIFARGGSQGIKNKNIKLLNGKPLIQYSIDIAKHSKYIQKVFVSTDSQEIADISLQCGATIPFIRPDYLATNDSPEILSWKHIINNINEDFDIFVSIPTVCPFKTVEDVDTCIEKFIKYKPELLITSVKASKSPYFNIFRKIDDNNVEIFDNSYKNKINRQSFQNIVVENTNVCYISTPNRILQIKNDNIFTDFKKIMIHQVSRINGFDLDNELDWKFAEYLSNNI